MSTLQPTMRLFSSTLGDVPTFRLMPVSTDCPYVEGIFDPSTKVLVLMSVHSKEQFHMTPKLDDNGDILRPKSVRASGKNYKEERKILESFVEYYILEKQEIQDVINGLAVNATTFDYDKYFATKKVIVSEEKKVITTP